MQHQKDIQKTRWMDHDSPPMVGGAAAATLGLTQQLAAERHSIRNKLDHDDPRGPHLCPSMILKSSCAQQTVSRSAGLKGQEVDELHLRVQPISAYIASPDNFCKGIITGPDAGTTPTELLDHLLAPGVEILHARMMGRTATAIITFSGLKVCGICLTVGHRVDICPTPSIKRCTTCGTENPSSTEPHQCQPRCLTCKGDLTRPPIPAAQAGYESHPTRSECAGNSRNKNGNRTIIGLNRESDEADPGPHPEPHLGRDPRVEALPTAPRTASRDNHHLPHHHRRHHHRPRRSRHQYLNSYHQQHLEVQPDLKG
ncbi:hypothetical protein HPB49_023009 [Dermacentor silvarum]|uniref:Uncharacterized protein n=1 Tax=Dermacentor silvarum TaxID=543639 RepID=A0ACB8DLC9_DERSI|nr:hypothetical protein HPB49_023009 [Dermacentor silvarum]